MATSAATKLLTLVIPLRRCASASPPSLQLLLGYKKRGFGQHRWNGFGGKVEATDASIAEAAVRELQEESCLLASPQQLQHRGIIVQRFLPLPQQPPLPLPLEIHVFTVEQWEGREEETEEMRPQWWTSPPYDAMWPDDRFWYPLLLTGRSFIADYVFHGLDSIVAGGVDEVQPEQLRQWSWQTHRLTPLPA